MEPENESTASGAEYALPSALLAMPLDRVCLDCRTPFTTRSYRCWRCPKCACNYLTAHTAYTAHQSAWERQQVIMRTEKVRRQQRASSDRFFARMTWFCYGATAILLIWLHQSGG